LIKLVNLGLNTKGNLQNFMKNIVIILFIISISSAALHSQPSSMLSFIGGYSIPMGDLKGKFGSTWATFTTNQDSNTYFLQNGLNFGMDMKFAPYKSSKFKIIGGVHFTSFTQGAQYSDTAISVLIDYGMRIFSMSVGLEYSYVTKTSKINPFVNAQFTVNLFSGNYDETYSNGNTTNLTLKSAARFGLRLGGGLDIPLGRRLGAVIGVNYNLANLLGRKSTGDFGSQYSLNDKEGVVNNVPYKNKSINYLNIFAGFSLYLGI
jgi:hypothetical protein